ncbi:MAG: hypothetical protein OES79_10155, partial [Planctomycetota bacterium]|nr:hypothetical protein [Planctomycetota bacterium]
MSHAENGGNNGPNRGGVYVFLGALIAMVIVGWLARSTGATSWKVAFQLSQVVVISVVIWQVCDPFADAAQWVGTALRLPGSVRGATLDAIASSMPELFSGIFFVVLAVTTAQETARSVAHAGGEGFSATVATCAGSAVYNMILIPAFCALVISVKRPSRPTIDVESKVISRDGLWFLGCEIILIVFLSLPAMHWWMSVIFMALYAVYILQLWGDARSYQRAHDAIADHLDQAAGDISVAQLDQMLRGDGIKVPQAL